MSETSTVHIHNVSVEHVGVHTLIYMYILYMHIFKDLVFVTVYGLQQ